MTDKTPLTDEQIDAMQYARREFNCYLVDGVDYEALRAQAKAYNTLRAQLDKAGKGMPPEPDTQGMGAMLALGIWCHHSRELRAFARAQIGKLLNALECESVDEALIEIQAQNRISLDAANAIKSSAGLAENVWPSAGERALFVALSRELSAYQQAAQELPEYPKIWSTSRDGFKSVENFIPEKEYIIIRDFTLAQAVRDKQEIDDLKHDNARHLKICSEQAEEIERLSGRAKQPARDPLRIRQVLYVSAHRVGIPYDQVGRLIETMEQCGVVLSQLAGAETNLESGVEATSYIPITKELP